MSDTPNFDYDLPTVDGDEGIWGTKLNNIITQIDSDLAQTLGNPASWANMEKNGADKTGVANIYDSLVLAQLASDIIYFGKGTYNLATNITLSANKLLVFEKGAVLSVANGVTLTANNTLIQAGLWQIFNLNTSGVLAGTWNVPKTFPEWFGAKRDGSTDDYTYINQAITFSSYAMKVCQLSTGTYNISASIVGYTGLTLKGMGKEYTILNATASCFLDFDNCSKVTLIDFQVNWNNYSGYIYFQAITASLSDIVLKNLKILNSGNVAGGLYSHNILFKRFGVYNMSNILVDNVYCNGAASDGDAYGDNLYVGSYSADGPGTMKDIFINNCNFKNAGRQNISLAGDHSGDVERPDNVCISNCVLENSSLAGLDLEEAKRVTVTNVHFINSGAYTGYYDGSHFAELYPATEMRSALSLHNPNDCVISNCIFTDCYYSFGGYGEEINVSNCKLYDSKISNALAASTGRLLFSNCEFIGDDGTDYLIVSYNGRLLFSNCEFKGSTTSGYFIYLSQNASSTFRETNFNGCRFLGESDLSIDCFYIQYGYFDFKNCIFKDFGVVFKQYQSTGYVDLSVDNCHFNTCELIVDEAYKGIETLKFTNNYCYNAFNILLANTAIYDLFFKNNIFLLNFSTGDGLTHIAINIGTSTACRNFVYTDNYMAQQGNATDVVGIRMNVRSQEIATESINISHNQFKATDYGFGVYLYAASTLAVNSIITHNQGVSMGTLLIASITGVNTAASIIERNIDGSTILDLEGSTTWDPGSLVDGAGETSSSITVSGAIFGDYVLVSAPYDLQGITCNGYVSSSGNINIRLQNETGGTIDLASGTWNVRVLKG